MEIGGGLVIVSETISNWLQGKWQAAANEFRISLGVTKYCDIDYSFGCTTMNIMKPLNLILYMNELYKTIIYQCMSLTHTHIKDAGL